jgi:hypothetical protein
MDKKSKPEDILSTVTAGIGVAVGGIILNEVMRRMNKMFGEEIPKGVVREMMLGVMDGLVYHFEEKVETERKEKEKFECRNAELLKEIDELKEANEKLEVELESKKGKKK